MSPRILCDGRAVLHVGDCLEILRGIPPSSVDSVVTDPPYGLSDHKPADVVACLAAWLAGEEYRPNKKGFMGRTWDSWVPGPEVWREVWQEDRRQGSLFGGKQEAALVGERIDAAIGGAKVKVEAL